MNIDITMHRDVCSHLEIIVLKQIDANDGVISRHRIFSYADQWVTSDDWLIYMW
jgi:hypothetical protein